MSSQARWGVAETRLDGKPPGQEQPRTIRERSFGYALRAIRLYQHLQKQKESVGWTIGKQFLHAACSIGANVEEAQSAESRADFAHKLGIAQNEARESLYWLRLLGESQVIASAKLDPLVRETDELLRILASIILTTKRGKDHRNERVARTHNS